MPDYQPITKPEAIAAVTERSWEAEVELCGHTGCEDHRGPSGKRIIHCYSLFGCDVSLDNAIAEIETAQEVGWADHILRHDLAVKTEGGKWHHYDVPRPRVAPVLAEIGTGDG